MSKYVWNNLPYIRTILISRSPYSRFPLYYIRHLFMPPHLEIDDSEEGGDGAPPERLEHRARQQDGHEDDLGGGAPRARRPPPAMKTRVTLQGDPSGWLIPPLDLVPTIPAAGWPQL